MYQKNKEEIRTQILNLLRNQKEEERLRKSAVIGQRLFALPEFQNARRIFFYASFDGEVETFTMMKQAMRLGKKIALPTILQQKKEMLPIEVDHVEDLQPGAYGIQEPPLDMKRCVDIEALDLCVVPGVAFDREGHRLGRGAGYYDRFLCSLPREVSHIGLAFQFQVLDELPHEEHDIPVQHVLTE